MVFCAIPKLVTVDQWWQDWAKERSVFSKKLWCAVRMRNGCWLSKKKMSSMAQGAQLVGDRARTWPCPHLCLPIWFRQILERSHGFTWCCLASPAKAVIAVLSPIPCTEWDPLIRGSDWACFSVVWSSVHSKAVQITPESSPRLYGTSHVNVC